MSIYRKEYSIGIFNYNLFNTALSDKNFRQQGLDIRRKHLTQLFVSYGVFFKTYQCGDNT